MNLSICGNCGMETRRIRVKGRRGYVRVEKKQYYFIPAFDGGGEKFLTNNGTARGKLASDGRIGYKEHFCPAGVKR